MFLWTSRDCRLLLPHRITVFLETIRMSFACSRYCCTDLPGIWTRFAVVRLGLNAESHVRHGAFVITEPSTIFTAYSTASWSFPFSVPKPLINPARSSHGTFLAHPSTVFDTQFKPVYLSIFSCSASAGRHVGVVRVIILRSQRGRQLCPLEQRKACQSSGRLRLHLEPCTYPSSQKRF